MPQQIYEVVLRSARNAPNQETTEKGLAITVKQTYKRAVENAPNTLLKLYQKCMKKTRAKEDASTVLLFCWDTDSYRLLKYFEILPFPKSLMETAHCECFTSL